MGVDVAITAAVDVAIVLMLRDCWNWGTPELKGEEAKNSIFGRGGRGGNQGLIVGLLGCR